MTVNPDLSVVNDFVAELYKAGVRDACVSPGSRSTPLTMAFARHQGYRVWNLLDERSASFFALGLARASQLPVALICTSGTAAGNYLPAVMEAKQTGVPLLVLTADRPPELREVGSNQTSDQVKLYGTHVKWFVEMSTPDGSPGLASHARVTAWRLTSQAKTKPPGPVHMNWPFREPLVPPKPAVGELTAGGGSDFAQADSEGFLVHSWYEGELTLSTSSLVDLATRLAGAKRGLIVCGPQEDESFAGAVTDLARTWNVPVLADALSQVRCGAHDLSLVVDTYDALLRDPGLWDVLQPDVIVRFGRTPTSKVLGKFLAHVSATRQIVVSDSPQWKDPFYTASDIVHADPTLFCRDLEEHLTGVCTGSWSSLWRQLNDTAAAVIRNFAVADPDFEARTFVELADLLPEGSLLFAGNSMPVRDLDGFFLKQPRQRWFMANRGVSGIDGVVSTALGMAAGSSRTSVLVIGDVSFYHDLNGWLAAKKYSSRLITVLVNNDGGGIFSFLPQANYPDTFEHFRTQHGLDFRPVVEMYGGSFVSVRGWADFRVAFNRALTVDNWTVIEVRTNGDSNVALHQALYQRVREQAGEVLAWNS